VFALVVTAVELKMKIAEGRDEIVPQHVVPRAREAETDVVL